MPARQNPREVGLPHAQRQLADVFAITDQTVEGIEFDFVVMLPAVQSVD
jgi:hypothetical protein